MPRTEAARRGWPPAAGALLLLPVFLHGCGSDSGDAGDTGTAGKANSTPTTSFLAGHSKLPSTSMAGGSSVVPSVAPSAEPRSRAGDAQFLMQASFGPTRRSLAELQGKASFAAWIREQQALPAGSHREYYRSRVNARGATGAMAAAEQRGRCEAGSLWQRVAFTAADVGQEVVADGATVTVAGRLRTRLGENGLEKPSICSDEPPRWQKSCLPQNLRYRCRWNPNWAEAKYCQRSCWNAGLGYAGLDCSVGWPALRFTGYVCEVEERLGGVVRMDARKDCSGGGKNANDFTAMRNPGIWLNEQDLYGSAGLAPTRLASGAATLPEAPSPCGLAEFVQAEDGLFYRHEPRLFLLENSLASPAAEPRKDGECVHAPKSRFNEASCRMLPSSCSGAPVEGSTSLSAAALAELFKASGRYVFVVTGLRAESSPCGQLSRWLALDCAAADCAETALAAGDASAIRRALSAVEGSIRDVTPSCSAAPAGAKVATEGRVFQHVHLQEKNVYDFTAWAALHPGGEASITAWAKGGFELKYPLHHGMERWEGRRAQAALSYLGRFGGNLSFSALPAELQKQSVASALFGALSRLPYAWACGSPGEVASKPQLGNQLSMVMRLLPTPYQDGALDTPYWQYEVPSRHAKATTWFMKALYGEDQLRQRVAWALAQIFVVGVPGIGMDGTNEMYVALYDIFVRNAFAPFQHLLREVTYSPMMGKYLSFIRSWSFDTNGNYPDENFAREIMQLFTIGIWKLNPDGSQQTDASGDAIPTYGNEEIMDFARVFTGFDYNAPRSNIEPLSSSINAIDPMRMRGDRHDVYPKMDLNGGYLGDGYPLCSDLPAQAFLASGATWDLEAINNSTEQAVFVLPTGSQLFAALCGMASPPCNFQRRVTLTSALPCAAGECSLVAGSVPLVQVGTAFYRYMPPTCVHLFFFGVGTESMEQDGPWTRARKRTCRDRHLPAAGASCCRGCTNEATNWMQGQGKTCSGQSSAYMKARCSQNSGWVSGGICEKRCAEEGVPYPGREVCQGGYEERRACAFPRQRMSFPEARAACRAAGMEICWRVTAAGCGHELQEEMDVWTNESCAPNISISAQGLVASRATEKAAANRFRVVWTGGRFPKAAAPPEGCSVVGSGLECSYSLRRQAAFEVVPSAAGLRRWLKVGAPPPVSPCTVCDGEVRAYAGSGGIGSAETVFEHEGEFFRNVEELVVVGDASFRNPPSFFGAAAADRAAEAEVEALLEHLATHANTAPFISRLLIQRLTVSTPSKGYVAAVAEAFSTGAYGSERFSGKYGDLAATVAAVLLHPEARSAAGGTAGQLREPVVKLTHMMRALEYQDREGREVVMHGSGKLVDMIGQWPYYAPHVFNFFMPGYRPVELPEGVTAPEFEIFTPPFVIGWLNGAMALIEDGLSSCNEGFGVRPPSCSHHAGYHGALNLSLPESSEGLGELDLLLTGGRLGPSKDTVRRAFEAAAAGQKMKAAQKAMVMTPEFNTLGGLAASGKTVARGQQGTGGKAGGRDDYKAVVLLFLRGGADTFNMLVPLACNLTKEYLQVRSNVALEPGLLIPVATSGQACPSFGLHPSLPFLQSLYNEGGLAFVSNVGNLVEPLTAAQWGSGGGRRCSGLFSHSDQVLAAHTLQCQSKTAAAGFGGLMGDVLAAKGFSTQSFSVAGQAAWPAGLRTSPIVLSEKEGAVYFARYEESREAVGNITEKVLGNVYAETFNKRLHEGLEGMERLRRVFENVSVATAFDGEVSLCRQLQQVARAIKTRVQRGAQRDLFYVELSGFDHHADEELAGLAELYRQLNAALQSFVLEMKLQGVWDKVVLMSGSDFGRTLTSNGGGTDHAYAGNHFLAGGKVRGGRVYNDFPRSLLEGNDQDIGRGRLVPKYPLESIYAPVAEWMGLGAADLATPFRNLQNFRAEAILAKSAVFRE